MESTTAWRGCALRYFNPAGAHSAHLGEVPLGRPMLVPLIAEIALGRRKELRIFGGHLNSKDGTPVRDWIHIEDLAEAHVLALQQLVEGDFGVFNLGTGHGSTVLEVLRSFEKACGFSIPYTIQEPRAGDAVHAVAAASRASEILKWQPKRGLDEITQSAWSFALENPSGYHEAYEEMPTGLPHLPWPEVSLPGLSEVQKEIREVSEVVGHFHEAPELLSSSERGVVVELGGTRLRVFRFEGGRYEGLEEVVPEHLKSSHAEELFDFMASLVGLVCKDLAPGESMDLRLVFSFALSKGRLKRWAKGWAVSGVEGEDVAKLMDEALRRSLSAHFRVHEAVNDCVSSLFASKADVAVVVGTGTNACYLDEKGYVISTEWAQLTCFPGAERNFERMVSGLYLPRIVEVLCGESELTMEDVAASCEASDSDLKRASTFALRRSAAFVARGLAAVATLAARSKRLVVLVDGALFQLPMYKQLVESFLLRQQLDINVKLHLVKDAASIGAKRLCQRLCLKRMELP